MRTKVSARWLTQLLRLSNGAPMDNKERIKAAIQESLLVQGLELSTEEDLERETDELLRYSLYLNEISRQHLLHALRQGRISVDEFKRRALNNDPHGQGQQRFS